MKSRILFRLVLAITLGFLASSQASAQMNIADSVSRQIANQVHAGQTGSIY